MKLKDIERGAVFIFKDSVEFSPRVSPLIMIGNVFKKYKTDYIYNTSMFGYESVKIMRVK